MRPQELEVFVVAAGLSARFFRGLDTNDPDLAAAQFTVDGRWYRKGVVLEGLQAIRAAVSAREPARRTSHHVHNLLVVAEGEKRATARFMLVVHDAVEESPARVVAILDCTDRLVRAAEGWRIAEKRSQPHLTNFKS